MRHLAAQVTLQGGVGGPYEGGHPGAFNFVHMFQNYSPRFEVNEGFVDVGPPPEFIRAAAVNAARNLPKSAEVKFPSSAAQAVAEGCAFFGGRPRGRDGCASSGGVMAAFERRCSGISSAC